jgi:hypothetical protein
MVSHEDAKTRRNLEAGRSWEAGEFLTGSTGWGNGTSDRECGRWGERTCMGGQVSLNLGLMRSCASITRTGRIIHMTSACSLFALTGAGAKAGNAL